MSDLGLDTHREAERKRLPSMWDALDGTLDIDGALRRAGELRKDLTAWERQGRRLMERIVDGRADAERSRVDTTQRLERPTEAYMDAWLAGDERERVALVTVTDPPIPEVHDDNA